MKYCSSCGYGMQNGFAFCPRCGERIGTEAPVQREQTDDSSRIRLEDLDERYEIVPAQPRRTAARGYAKNYTPAWKDPVMETVPTPVVTYRDMDTQQGNFGWWILGFLLPIAGFVLYLCFRENRPGAARSLGTGAYAMLILLAVVFGIGAFLTMKGYLVLV